MTLRKKGGEYSLLIWNEVRNYDDGARREIVNAPVPVVLRLQTPVAPKVTILTQSADGKRFEESTATVKDGMLSLAVADAPMIVRIMPLPVGNKAAPPAPATLTGTATENTARLSWTPSARVTDIAGYFVFRNDRYIAHTAGTGYTDTSAWLRPGLGYTYAVQAYDKSGNMSPRKTIVLQTAAAKFPDVAIDSVSTEPTNPKPGDPVTFKATVRNVGDGATPNEVSVTATFFVNGKYTTFESNSEAPYKPGETRELRVGPVILAVPQDAHTTLITCMLDDINRLPGERDKMNNLADQTLLIGVATQGMIIGMAKGSPGVVNLSAEGTEDWAHFGLDSKDAVNRKVGGGNKIGALTPFGDGYLDATPGFGVGASWADGVPVAVRNDSHVSLWWNHVGKGVRFTVPADNSERIVWVYVGGVEGARGRFTAKLSDGSAPEYVSATFDGNYTAKDWAGAPGSFTALYSARYKAA